MYRYSAYLSVVLLCSVNLSVWAKPSIYFGMNVNLPVQQQTTITHHVQPIYPQANVQHYQATYTNTSKKDHWGVPEELSRFSKPTSVYYQPSYPTSTSHKVVYVPTTVVYQNHVPVQNVVHISFRVGDTLPVQYRQMDYWVSDWQQARLAEPPQGHVWLNVAGRFMLVNQSHYAIVKIQ